MSELFDRFHAAAPEVLHAPAPRLFAASRFLREAIEALLAEPADFTSWTRARDPGAIAARLSAGLAGVEDEGIFLRVLRRQRRYEMARIAWRDLAGLAALDETLQDLSELADAAIQAALDHVERRLQARHGVPRGEGGVPCRPVVLGMGKLGGRELNFSSDIDLIFCHTEPGETDGARPISGDEYFAKLAQDVSRLLASRTEDGFAFRVDTLLRPFGSAGALSASFAALEDYYQVHGREWERYALIKARPVAGDLSAGEQLLLNLRPFIYRRYLDYNAIGSLRELKRMIAEDVERKGVEDHIKLGAGGIRELEFIVQSFQLVRGGAEPRLRGTGLRLVLRTLGSAGHLDMEVAERLDGAYVFLRRVENAIQMYADEQQHALPRSEEARAALCAAMDVPDWAALLAQLDPVRRFVQEQFQRVFADPQRRPQSRLQSLIESIWRGHLEGEAAIAGLTEAGFAEGASLVLDELLDLRGARLVRALREDGVAKLLALLALLSEEAFKHAHPHTALRRTLRIVQAVAGRSTYLTLLRENDAARAQLVLLASASPWLSEFIAQSPVLLDNLLDPRSLYAPPDREELAAELSRRCAELGGAETEAAMDLLRRYQKEVTLRVAAADLVHALPLVKVSDRLTWLAEVILAQALDYAWAEMRAQYGQPMRSDGQPAGFAVIAYGKFGGIELGYGSDLDLVFLHDCDRLDEDSQGGARSINNGNYFSRLAQRLINWLATQTSAGRAYEIDMELRPNGRSGLLVTGLSAFAEYQRDAAWTWEHQALTRARWVGGSPEIGKAFASLRAEVLQRPRDPEALRREIAEMRAKMRASLDKSTPEFWDLKQGEGGLVDLEFITQYLVLRDAHRDPGLVTWSDNWRQLEALQTLGSLQPAETETLIACYRAYRAFAHARSLQNEPVQVPAGEFLEERRRIAQLWGRWLGQVAEARPH